jgi:hypothetical protein
MSSRYYTAEFENIAVTAAVDFFEFQVGDDRPIELAGLFITQSTEVASNVGEDELLRFRIIRGHATTGTGGAGQAVAPVPIDPNDPAAGFTYDTNNTTIASAGTAVNLHSGTFNVRNGLEMWWPHEFGPGANQSSLLVVRLLSTPADSISFSGTAYVREV